VFSIGLSKPKIIEIFQGPNVIVGENQTIRKYLSFYHHFDKKRFGLLVRCASHGGIDAYSYG
jgi:hypothetical protein